MAIHDPAFGQIVGRKLHTHPVTQQYANVVLTHLAGEVRQDLGMN